MAGDVADALAGRVVQHAGALLPHAVLGLFADAVIGAERLGLHPRGVAVAGHRAEVDRGLELGLARARVNRRRTAAVGLVGRPEHQRRVPGAMSALVDAGRSRDLDDVLADRARHLGAVGPDLRPARADLRRVVEPRVVVGGLIDDHLGVDVAVAHQVRDRVVQLVQGIVGVRRQRHEVLAVAAAAARQRQHRHRSVVAPTEDGRGIVVERVGDRLLGGAEVGDPHAAPARFGRQQVVHLRRRCAVDPRAGADGTTGLVRGAGRRGLVRIPDHADAVLVQIHPPRRTALHRARSRRRAQRAVAEQADLAGRGAGSERFGLGLELRRLALALGLGLGGAAVGLLREVRDLVADERQAARRAGIVHAGREVQPTVVGHGLGADRGRERAVALDADAAQVQAERGAHLRLDRGRQAIRRLAGIARALIERPRGQPRGQRLAPGRDLRRSLALLL